MRIIRKGPLPPDIFEEVNASNAVVFLKDGRCQVIYRDPMFGMVYNGGAHLEFKYAPHHQRWIKSRWLADLRRRELHLDALPRRHVAAIDDLTNTVVLASGGRRSYLADAEWEATA
jgi:hypothetical protein